MKNIRELAPVAVWNVFADMCAIPHASGNEKNLARHLRAFAKEHGLKAVVESTGNLWIERAPSPGFENAPTVILQGHLDMVPAKRDDVSFDFAVDPIVPVVEGSRVSTGGRTTLGADNGIGVALAIALAMDETLKCGRLKVLCTREEESGLRGAIAAKADHFNAQYLINLDSEHDNTVFVGCAGGAHFDARFPLSFAASKPGLGLKISLSGLKGGHSGENIDDRRGNAVTMLAEFLREHPEFQIYSLCGGNVRNAIPVSAEVVGVADTALPGQLRRAALEKLSHWMQQYDIGTAARFNFELVDAHDKVWNERCRESILQILQELPQGVLGRAANNQVMLSNNIGRVSSDEKNIWLYTHPRANINSELDDVLGRMTRFVNSRGGRSVIGNTYSAWESEGPGMLFDVANAASQRLFKRKLKAAVMHAGIECGIFAGKNPKLEMISLGPQSRRIHTPDEYVEIASVERCYKLVHRILSDLPKHA